MLAQTEPTARPKSDGASALRLLVTYAAQETELGRATFLAPGMEIGRGPESAQRLVVDDSEMSRRHVIIEGTREAPTVRDLGSRNGTFVNGFSAGTRPLASGDVMRLGSTVLEVEEVRPEHVALVTSAPPRSPRILGASLALLEAIASVRAVAELDVPVLLLGETGVGKELFAREIHEVSRRKGPFVPVNCAALPQQLAESELFGHEKGAFTGAERASAGLFGEATGGTLFLDEIGEMQGALQPKLLRALAMGEVRAVGATRAQSVDARVIAATNIQIEDAIADGSFRADLFARIAGAVIVIPPLRERRGDVMRLARELLLRASTARRPTTTTGELFAPDAAESLSLHRWRFNVRELEQQMRALASRVPDGRIELAHLPPLFRVAFDVRTGQTTEVPRDALALLNIASDRIPTRDELVLVVGHFDGNVSQAATFFGKDRRQLYRWAERLGVDLGQSR